MTHRPSIAPFPLVSFGHIIYHYTSAVHFQLYMHVNEVIYIPGIDLVIYKLILSHRSAVNWQNLNFLKYLHNMLRSIRFSRIARFAIRILTSISRWDICTEQSSQIYCQIDQSETPVVNLMKCEIWHGTMFTFRTLNCL